LVTTSSIDSCSTRATVAVVAATSLGALHTRSLGMWTILRKILSISWSFENLSRFLFIEKK
jgi:hypothetical protein